MKQVAICIASIAFLVSCTPSPRAIDYGMDVCNYCKMTIVDQQHAAELVTDKGKIFVFDAIECMLHQMRIPDQAPAQFLLVNDFENPSVLIDASTAIYLISENVPSPMGANLSAFSSEVTAMQMQRDNGGQVYTWNELQSTFDKLVGRPVSANYSGSPNN